VADSYVRVQGYRELARLCRKTELDCDRFIRGALREIGQVVRVDAVDRLSRYNTYSASHLGVRVADRSVDVVQRLSPGRGVRRDWGRFQARRILLPARAAHKEETIAKFQEIIEILRENWHWSA
jgi:phosphate uptake regulator